MEACSHGGLFAGDAVAEQFRGVACEERSFVVVLPQDRFRVGEKAPERWSKRMRKRTNENGGKTGKNAVLKRLGEAKAILEKCQQHRLQGWMSISIITL
jgi:hypothetical protein